MKWRIKKGCGLCDHNTGAVVAREGETVDGSHPAVTGHNDISLIADQVIEGAVKPEADSKYIGSRALPLSEDED